MANACPEPRKDWSLSEWIANFLQDDQPYYEEAIYDDIYDDRIPDGEGAALDDDGLIEALVIVTLVASLGILLYYRQQRQQQAQRREEEAGRQQQGAQPAQQERGLFPQPGDPDFANWIAGGVGP